MHFYAGWCTFATSFQKFLKTVRQKIFMARLPSYFTKGALFIPMKKIFTLFLGFAVCSSLNAQNIKTLSLGLGTPGIDEPQLMGLSISPNGKYACGALESGAGYFVADLENDLVKFEISTDDEGAELRHVDNNGVAIGYNGPGVTYSIEGVETVLAPPSDEYKYILGEALSNDGSVLTGSLVAKGYLTLAAYSKNGGAWTLLPQADEDVLGDYAGQGSSAKYVSGDGKVILGYVGSFGPATLWIENENGEYDIDPIFSKYIIMNDEDLSKGEKVLYDMQPMGISNNGKYALCQGVIRTEGGATSVPVVYNVETQEIAIYSEPQNIDPNGYGLLPTAIADDGTFVGIIGTQPLYMSAGSFIWMAGDSQASTLGQEYPVYEETFGFPDSVGYCLPTGISADGRYILGYGFYSPDFEDPEAPAYFTTYVIDANGAPTAVETVKPTENQTIDQIYSVDGKRIERMSNGINIVRMSDGSVRKILK